MLIKFYTLVCLMRVIVAIQSSGQDPRCPIIDLHFDGSQRTFHFPKGQGSSHRHITCTYEIINSKGTPINFTVSALELLSTDNCASDYVRVSDQSDFSGGLTYSKCEPNTDLQRVFNSTADVMYLQIKASKLESNSKVVGSYTGKEESTEQKARCPDLASEFDGTETVLDFPKEAGTGKSPITCTYGINNTKGLLISFILSELELPSTTNCERDYLKVSNEHDFSDGLTYSNCEPNNNLQRVFTSFNNVIHVKIKVSRLELTSKVVGRYKGGQYDRCPVVPESFDGTATTLNFPEGSGADTKQFTCNYQINNPKKLEIEFRLSALELPSTANCENDYVTVSNKNDFSDGLIYSECEPNNNLQRVFTSTADVMYLRIKVTRLEESSKVIASYKKKEESTEQKARCPNLASEFDGTETPFTFPEGVGTEENPITCIYKIRNTKGSPIVFTVSQLELLSTDNCKSDYVRISNKDDFSDGLTYSNCEPNNDLQRVFTSTTNVIHLQIKASRLEVTSKVIAHYKGGTSVVVTNLTPWVLVFAIKQLLSI